MADVTQTLTVSTGSSGRVKLHAASPIILAGISKWNRTSKANAVPFAHFESGADGTTGLVQPDVKQGLGSNSVHVEGWYNSHATDQTEIGTTAITNGATVALDLMVTRSPSKGYSNVTGIVTNFQLGVEIENKVTSFSFDLEVSGVFPAYGTVT